ncbi:dATP/dGTP pyrophosphohydrolase domain-containing protein [Escherichia coli]|uniref:dATP/dGTP pyrophosphohydrolase domain-containing protein n=1 Tax=Escherichia coli TaxID=562 RepID=UPI0010204243|nr:dATP/dGTP pyrophosphohydrolase domain-containing protein [Escherichia coli]
MTTITKERLLTIKQWRETYGPGSNVVLPAEEAEELVRIALASLEREQIRHEHAKWSDSTFGCVGPIGPLKHLSKEALEAAAEPDDLSEWADMQFLLWDAQRRAGISDAEITVAMEDKLKINMERQWPEPKDGEPRLHIKEPGNSPVTPDSWISCSERMPNDKQYVWCWGKSYSWTECDTFEGYYDCSRNKWWAVTDNGEEPASKVTHWMPLPEPPQEVK